MSCYKEYKDYMGDFEWKQLNKPMTFAKLRELCGRLKRNLFSKTENNMACKCKKRKKKKSRGY